MIKTSVLPAPKRKRGNPNWGQLRLHIPALPTEFEIEVRKLGLTNAEYLASYQLRLWCERNRNRVYIPEWLLEEWGIHVEASFGEVA